MLDIVLTELPLRVVVHDCVIEGLKPFCQFGNVDVEACGVLLGRVYDGAIEVTDFTPPQATDTRSRTSYIRQRDGHLEAAVQAWERSGGLEGYVGEWHTHPEPCPSPSSKDCIEVQKIARANLDLVVVLILGQEQGCLFAATNRKLTAPINFLL